MDEYDNKLLQAVKFCLKVIVGIFLFLFAMLFMYSLNSCTTKKHIVKDVVTTSYDSSSVSHTQTSDKKIFEDSQKIADTEEGYMLIKFGQDGCIELATDGTKKLKGVQGVKINNKRQHSEEKATKSTINKDSIADNKAVVSNNKKAQHIDKTIEAPTYKFRLFIIAALVTIILLVLLSRSKYFQRIKKIIKKFKELTT